MGNTHNHAETVGSLQRPQYLLDARVAHQKGVISTAKFKRTEDRAVDEAIALQESVGLQVITDGEQRRHSFLDYIVKASTGLSAVESLGFTLRGLNGDPDIPMKMPVSVTERVRSKCSTMNTEEFVYLRAKTAKLVKVTVPSPLCYLVFIGENTRSVYDDPFDLFYDAAIMLREECARLSELGCEYIQIDAPELTWPGDPFLRETAFPERLVSADRFAGEACDLLNTVTDVPNVRFGIHLCRGNHPTHAFSLGSYEAVAAKAFKKLKNVTTFLLEYDDPRSGSFECLTEVPEDKSVVLGLISSMKRPTLESPNELVRRIEDAARYFPRANLAISPQCGFCSQLGFTGFDRAVQEAKLRLLVDVARRVWA